ncbi:MAG: transpeptidase family protein [Bacteroides sp.]|nr:transpeptidase family protein [Roseburia sp.]MCM1346519.1 transpeptidase family protein [Bacteroides sp.]MCM1420099.1 transpeptidase family protein [Bacteroides sp.]
MKFDKKYISGRFIGVVIVALILCVAIVWRALYTMTVERERWQKIASFYESENKTLKSARGNILSADGQLMASSLPDYKVYLDFLSGVPKKSDDPDEMAKRDSLIRRKDSIFLSYIDTICVGLSDIAPRMSASEYKKHLKKGLEKHSRYYEVCPRVVLNYIQFNELVKLPLFNEKNRYVSGLVVEERNNRKKPFGSLAKRTLGEMFGAKDSARSGIELAYDSLLRGTDGKIHRKKVLSKYLDIIDCEPVDGLDIVTTIDVSMQDICESALREKLKELDATMGVVVLMEVKTGDVKAIVNLQRYDDGEYYEARNYALASLMEPGSTFKTASIMVALDDGKITVNDLVDTGCGVYNMYGAWMRDHNWATRGGYHVIDVPHTLMYSSNIGVSRLIDENYHNHPEQFVEGLKRVGIGEPLNLPFVGAAEPRIRKPNKDNWSKTALAWMSIGYETQIPPISTVTFYNAIANGGKMVRPRFVKAVQKDGEIVEEFPVEVIKEKICKETTLKDIQEILKRVVNDKEGLGKRAGNPHFHVSGKTGTAQVSQGKGGYRAGMREYLVSFCGYYPSEDPKYSCIVAIRKPGYPASGGGMAGPVFAKIAARVYSKNVTGDISAVADSLSVFVPDVKNGDIAAAKYVLKELRVGVREKKSGAWGQADIEGNEVGLTARTFDDKTVPDLTDMGARDAVFAIESRGLKAKVHGVGQVKKQSVAAGTKVVAGQTVAVYLEK